MYNFKFDNQNIEMPDHDKTANKANHKSYHYEFECNYSVHDNEFLNTVNYLLGPQLLPGNKIQLLDQDGWQQTLRSIAETKRSICIEASADFNNPDGEEFGGLLAAKASSGVPVHFVQVGRAGLFSPGMHIKLTIADVELFTWSADESAAHGIATAASANPVSASRLSLAFTTLTLDGRVSFLISPDRKAVFKLEGPIGGQIQAAFNDKWMTVQEQITHGEFYFAQDGAANTSDDLAHYVDLSHSRTLHKFYLNIVYGIGAARETLTISEALLTQLPKELPPLDREIEKAKQRGVNVTVTTTTSPSSAASPASSNYAFLIADETWLSLIVKEQTLLNARSPELAKILLNLNRRQRA